MIEGQTKFQHPEYPRSGFKAMSIERKKERVKVSDNNGQYIRLNKKSVEAMARFTSTRVARTKIFCTTYNIQRPFESSPKQLMVKLLKCFG